MNHPITSNELRGNEAWQLALLQAWGLYGEAQAYLNALNRVQRAFGHPEYDMPEAASVGLPDLVSCPADQWTEARSDPFLPKEWAA